MGHKVVRLLGMVFLTLLVFKVVLQHSSAEPTTGVRAAGENGLTAGSASAQGDVPVTRIIYVTATPQPEPIVTPTTETAASGRVEPLRVIERSPMQSRAAEIQPTFRLVFNKVVDSFSTQPFLTVEPEIDMAIYWESSSVLLVRPTAPLEAETRYTFTIGQNLEAIDGAKLPNIYRWSFQPVVLNASKMYELLPDGRDSLRVTFNYPIDPATVTWSTEPAAAGELIWDDDFKGVTFISQDVLLAGKSYWITLGESLRQPDGFPAPTAGELNIVVDKIVQGQQPAPGSNNNNLLVTIRIAFRKNVDQARVESGLQIIPEPTALADVRWEENTLLA
jgi:hypothetical protein